MMTHVFRLYGTARGGMKWSGGGRVVVVVVVWCVCVHGVWRVCLRCGGLCVSVFAQNNTDLMWTRW